MSTGVVLDGVAPPVSLMIVAIRSAEREIVACMQVLAETELGDDAGVMRWLRELERAAVTAGEAQRCASELGAAIARAWARPLRSDRQHGLLVDAVEGDRPQPVPGEERSGSRRDLDGRDEMSRDAVTLL